MNLEWKDNFEEEQEDEYLNSFNLDAKPNAKKEEELSFFVYTTTHLPQTAEYL